MQTVDQLIDFLILAANFDLQTLGIGAHPTCQTEFLGEAPDKGAKANALNFVDAPMLKEEAQRWHEFQIAVRKKYLLPRKAP